MKVTLMDIFYTGSMLFLAFYGAIFITKFLAKDLEEEKEEEEENEAK